MQKLINCLKQEFDSSSTLTPEFATCYRIFKKELTALFTEQHALEMLFSRGHFEGSCFVKFETGIWYIHLMDVRGGDEQKSKFLVRTAKSFKDYTGGHNQYIRIEGFPAFIRKVANQEE